MSLFLSRYNISLTIKDFYHLLWKDCLYHSVKTYETSSFAPWVIEIESISVYSLASRSVDNLERNLLLQSISNLASFTIICVGGQDEWWPAQGQIFLKSWLTNPMSYKFSLGAHSPWDVGEKDSEFYGSLKPALRKKTKMSGITSLAALSAESLTETASPHEDLIPVKGRKTSKPSQTFIYRDGETISVQRHEVWGIGRWWGDLCGHLRTISDALIIGAIKAKFRCPKRTPKTFWCR